jgi:hypothetical protein
MCITFVPFTQSTDINYSDPMNITDLLERNRHRLQRGELIETETAFFVRYYVDEFYANGRRKTKCEKLADKGDIYSDSRRRAPADGLGDGKGEHRP